MSSCITDNCGTGDWTGPLPGDPDNNSILSAVPAFGGIDVSWTYPNINPHAVAHVLLYRGITSNYAASVKQATVTGSTFYDRITGTAGTRYYYWIQIVSVNGTVGTVIGPASAIARSRIEDTIVDLTGQIDQSALAIALKTEIGKISLNYQAILDEVKARIAGNSALSQALTLLNNRANTVETFVVNEITQRKDGDNALVTQFNLLAAANSNNTALIVEERNVRVTADTAFSQVQTTLDSKLNHPTTGLTATRATLINDYYTKVGTNEAIAAANLTLNSTVFNPVTGLPATRAVLINDYYTKAGTNSAISSATLGLVSQTGLNNSLGAYTNTASLRNEYYTKSDTNSAISNATLNLASKTTFNSYTTTADLQVTYYTKTQTDLAVSNAITNVQVRGPTGGMASIQQAMETQYNLNTGYSAMYTVKLSNNGLIGGFGLSNTGILVEAGFDVDRFWVGRTGPDKVKPFIIDNDVVYIDKARIRNADIDTLKIAGNAVTVPTGKTEYATFEGTGFSSAYIKCVEVTIYLDQPGWVYASTTGYIGYGQGWRAVETYLQIGGSVVSTGGGDSAWVNAVHSGSIHVASPGNVTATLWFTGQVGCRIYSPSIFIMGIKR